MRDVKLRHPLTRWREAENSEQDAPTEARVTAEMLQPAVRLSRCPVAARLP